MKKFCIVLLVLCTCCVFLTSATADCILPSITDTAAQFEGTAYTWGGEDPSFGFDCSGFVYYIFTSCGYTVSRTASGQGSDGMEVGLSQIQPGDVVIFGNGTSATHTAIYLGDGVIIHALNEANGVIRSNLSDYPDNIISVRRIAL